MKLPIAICILLLVGCSRPSIKAIDGRTFVRITDGSRSVPGVPGTEAIYQVSGQTGSGKPAYIRSLGSADSFTRVGDLP